MVIEQIKEYDPISYVTAIGDITITFRFYWISSKNNPFGLPRCDIQLRQDEKQQEVTGIDVRDWTEGFPSDLLDYHAKVVNTFFDLICWCEGPGRFNELALEYETTLIKPLGFEVSIPPEIAENPSLKKDNFMLGISFQNPAEPVFWTSLAPESFRHLQRVQLDLHLQIEVMRC